MSGIELFLAKPTPRWSVDVIMHSVKIEGLRQKKLYNDFFDKYQLSRVWRGDFRCF